MKSPVLRRIAAVLLSSLLILGSAPAARAEEETVDVLLIGLDRRPGLGGCRSDTMILCSYAPGSGTLTMVSFLRDLYLPIPGHGSDRLNAAYAYGGRELLSSTLEQNFGLDLEGCVEVDFSQFASIVDALGGVKICLREDEARTIRKYCPGSTVGSGEQLLNGEEALYFSRIRELDPDGDLSRARRQRTVLQAILDAWKGADLGAMLEALRKILPMVSTDLSPLQIMDWAFTAAPQRASLTTRSYQIPAPGKCWDETIRGMAVLVCDLEENRRILNGYLKDN